MMRYKASTSPLRPFTMPLGLETIDWPGCNQSRKVSNFWHIGTQPCLSRLSGAARVDLSILPAGASG